MGCEVVKLNWKRGSFGTAASKIENSMLCFIASKIENSKLCFIASKIENSKLCFIESVHER